MQAHRTGTVVVNVVDTHIWVWLADENERWTQAHRHKWNMS